MKHGCTGTKGGLNELKGLERSVSTLESVAIRSVAPLIASRTGQCYGDGASVSRIRNEGAKMPLRMVIRGEEVPPTEADL